MNPHLETALAWLAAGFSPLPPEEDGSKRPLADVRKEDDSGWTWKPYQTTPVSVEHLKRWYSVGRTGCGVCGGPGNLEPFEFDDRVTYEAFKAAAIGTGLGNIVERIESGYLEDTPSGGVHWFYTCSEGDGPTKLAQRPVPTETEPFARKTLIETKGQGGFIIVAPSWGKVHPSGGEYKLRRGGPGTIAAITPEERAALWDLAGTFDEMLEVEQTCKGAALRGEPSGIPELRPGEVYEAENSWEDVLEPLGWVKVYARGDVAYWRRPGKDHGVSATTGHCKGFKVFTSSTSFVPGEIYTKFGVFAHVRCGGDYSVAASELRKAGYGGGNQPHHADTRARAGTPGVGRNGDGNGNGGLAAGEVPDDGGDGDRGGGGGNGNGQHGVAVDKRPQVEVSRERHLSVDAAVVALGRDEDLYRRGDSLGIVVHEVDALMKLPEGVELHNARGAARFLPLSEHGVGCRLTRNATFYEWRAAKDPKKNEPESHDVHPPSWLIKAVATQGHWPGVRTLQGIADCPYVREDGTIPEPGFDRSTGTLYQPSFVLKDLPERPDQGDARQAWDDIFRMLVQFPFAKDSFPVWMAALLTAIQRPVIRGPVPGFAFNGNRAGVGKGLLIDTIGLIVWGHPIPTRAYPTDPAEAEKLKLALGLAATPVVHFDNLSEGSSYGSSVVDSCLTSITVSGRLLGISRDSGPVPLRCLWMLSGNNISVMRDAYRRWLPCNLESPLENPHERGDLEEANLREYVACNRARYIRDALIILKAHAAAGYPHQPGGPLGSFEQWDRFVRGAIHFTYGKECLDTQRKAASESPDRMDKVALLKGWLEAQESIAGHPLTAQEAIHMAARDLGGKLLTDKESTGKSAFPTLYSALISMSKDGRMPTPRSVGTHLRGLKEQLIDKMKLVRHSESRDGAVAWKVEVHA